jgi:hypothetical protein
MFDRFRTTLMLVGSLFLVGAVTTVDAGWSSGTVLESFRCWLGQPAQRTQLTVDHTDSGVVLELTSSDTATVNQLQAALPEKKTFLGQQNILHRKGYSDSNEAGTTVCMEDDRYEDDENDEDDQGEERYEDDEDHGAL